MVNNEEKQQHPDEAEVALRKSLARLDIQRKSIEHEADAIFSELTTPPSDDVEPMGIDTPLVDPEGYPRGDIDVYRARTLRQRFRVLQTDHKEIEGQIEGMLRQLALIKNPQLQKRQEEEKAARAAKKPKPKYDPMTGKWVVMNWDGTVAGIPGGEKRKFNKLITNQVSALTDDSLTRDTSTGSTTMSMREPLGPNVLGEPSELAFARVNAVAKDSPAEEAGLKEEDLIFQFANLNFENHNHLKEIASIVPDIAARQGNISISVKRRIEHSEEWETKTLSMTPRPWSGRGLVGCHIVPYTS
eukprot:scaffold12738_cov81-Cylindrotheca_fusiformis.AAC.2